VSAKGALLGYVKYLVKENYFIRTSMNATHTTGAFVRIDNHDTIISFVDGFLIAGWNAGSIITMLADIMEISDF